MSKKRLSYSWALRIDSATVRAAGLSREERDGLSFAKDLARNAKERSAFALIEEFIPERLTVAELADIHGLAPPTVHGMIKAARIALFGRVGDSGIYYQLKRREGHPGLEARICRASDCEKPLPYRSGLRRQYCSGSCRTDECRRRKAAAAAIG